MKVLRNMFVHTGEGISGIQCNLCDCGKGIQEICEGEEPPFFSNRKTTLMVIYSRGRDIKARTPRYRGTIYTVHLPRDNRDDNPLQFYLFIHINNMG